MADHPESAPLIPTPPIIDPTEIDLEAGPADQIQCRICLETDGNPFFFFLSISPFIFLVLSLFAWSVVT